MLRHVREAFPSPRFGVGSRGEGNLSSSSREDNRLPANAPSGTRVGDKFFTESLILAQDERWRRA